MSILKPADHCFIFYSILFNSKKITPAEICSIILDRLGPTVSFQHSFCPMKNYYSKEMGGCEEDLSRLLFVSMDCFDRNKLITEKIWADEFEKRQFGLHGLRSLNLDVGIISLENVILSTGKKYAHRVYLDNGVYAELTYQFQDFKFTPLNWTYPDYCQSDFIDFFTFCRSLLLRKL